MPKYLRKYQQKFTDAFQSTLRFYMGRESHSSSLLAAKIETTKSAADKWRQGLATPQIHSLLLLGHLYGAEFLSDVLRPFGFEVRDIEVSDASCPFEVAAITANTLAIITEALRDGRIDHRERAHLLKVLPDHIRAAQALQRNLSKEAA